MVTIGPVAVDNGPNDTDLAVFVDRLAAAGSDGPTALARRRIRQVIAAGCEPPGLRRLAESLVESLAELPPPPRQPTEDSSSVVAAMRSNGLVVLDGADGAAVAEAVATLLADGRRVVVTGSTGAELAEVRHHLPGDVRTRVVDRLPALAPGEIRELRTLLATWTPARRARAGQHLPDPAALPAPADVARLCSEAVGGVGAGPGGSTGLAGQVHGLLAGLDRDRRKAVTSVARYVHRALSEMPARATTEWAWTLLPDLVHGRHRPVFDRMLEDTAQAVAALDRSRRSPAVQIAAPLPPGATDTLLRYRDFLEDGGRSRTYFRSAEQRDAAPVLRLLRVGGRTPESTADIQRVIDHLEVAERLARVDKGCSEVGIAAPRDEEELNQLADGLVRVGAAARSVGALRHDVLFIAADSPLAVPDVKTAGLVARAVLDYSERGSSAEAVRTLERMAADVAALCPAPAAAPEHDRAVVALRARDARGYAAAADALGAARREVQDEARQTHLLRRLREAAPHLAGAWESLGERGRSALGFAVFTPIDALLSAVPDADSADVVVVLGAVRLGVERLLLTAVAPRMIAVLAPGEVVDDPPNLLSVMLRASALVIRGHAAATTPMTPRGAPRPAPVSQAGA